MSNNICPLVPNALSITEPKFEIKIFVLIESTELKTII